MRLRANAPIGGARPAEPEANPEGVLTGAVDDDDGVIESDGVAVA
jgi:hypothetical protein